MKLDTPLRRLLSNSLFQRPGGKLLLAAILIGLFFYALPNFKAYYLAQPLAMLAMLPLGFLTFLPTLLVLWFFDRREREPALLFLGVIFSVILFFGPVTSKTLHLAGDLGLPVVRLVGFVEDFWKVAPLLLLIIFVRPAVNGVRDGLIYGALGGLGFAILEQAAYFALEFFPEQGWSAYLPSLFGRANFLGTDIHVIFSAFVGAAIGYGLKAKGWRRYVVPIGAYLLIVFTHGVQDAFGKVIAVMGTAGPGLFLQNQGLSEEALAEGTAIHNVLLMFGSTTNLLLINIIVLPLLFWAVWASGDQERRVVREQLADEPGPVVTPAEYIGVEAERRLHLRTIPGYSKPVARKILQRQNELAFRKEYLQTHGGDLENDAPLQAIRQEIAQLRSNSEGATT
jgi:RsiW-degrading membrane proteinase PrsW (M82 family)